jgi:iron complex transport system permease protein
LGLARLGSGKGVAPGAVALGLLALVLVALGAALCVGPFERFTPLEAARGLAALVFGGEPLGASDQTILGWRLLRALAAFTVGAMLALSGGLLQGLFGNPLASPGVLGVSAGASLGASLVLAAIGGFGAGVVGSTAVTPAWITFGALLGALVVLVPLFLVAGAGGRLSVPSLLLAGMAMNALCAGLLAALQSLTLSDFEVARALFAWSFGTFEDRSLAQVVLAGSVLAAALLGSAWIARELDLLASGEDDAAALGVDVAPVKRTALFLAALLAATAVAVAGQIGFVGLVVPHLVRLVTKSGAHRPLLPLSALAGGTLVLAADVLPRAFLPSVDLRPGVVMSLFGAPFFLWLLWAKRGEMRTW